MLSNGLPWPSLTFSEFFFRFTLLVLSMSLVSWRERPDEEAISANYIEVLLQIRQLSIQPALETTLEHIT